MSQNGTTPTTDENRAPTTIATPLFFPMMPMFFPYGNANAVGQQYFPPAVYPNVQTYASTNNHRHANFGLGYNTFYTPFYATTNNILSPATHITNSPALIPPRPLMMPPPLIPISQQQQASTGSSSTNGIDNERNKNLNIRECQSPIKNQTKKEKKPLQIVDPNDINTDLRIREDSSSSSISSLISHSESEQNLLPPLSSSIIQEMDSDNPQDDFLTFIEQKTKTSITMPELNPFANEFSFGNNQTLTKDSTTTTNGINHHTDNDNQSSYRLLFDNLIEKSLESIEAIKKSTKKTFMNDASIQCHLINDSINRSTQTIDQINNTNDFIEEYSLRTIKLMDQLLENFQNIYQNQIHNQCKTMAHTCDELRHLILFIHHLVSLSKTEQQQQQQTPIDLDNPFSNMIQHLENDMNRYQTSSQIVHNNSAGRGTTRRLMTTTNNNSSLPSFSCRQIDPIIKPISKLCLLCQRPIDDSDDVMHKLCRSLSCRPNMSADT